MSYGALLSVIDVNAKELSTQTAASGDVQAPYAYGVTIVVVSAREQSELTVGQHMEVRTFPIVMGRSLDAGVWLADSTVSREHALLDVVDGQLMLHALSTSSKVWVNNELLPSGERIAFEANDTYVQLGGVLLRLNASVPTEPFQTPLAAPMPREDLTRDALVHIDIAQDAVVITLGGKLVQLHRGPAFVVAALAKTANSIANEADLLLVDGTAPDRALDRNLNQMITYARNALAKTLNSDPALRERVILAMREAAEAAGDEQVLRAIDDPALPNRDLTRFLVKNQRSFGYVLRLLPSDVAVTDLRD